MSDPNGSIDRGSAGIATAGSRRQPDATGAPPPADVVFLLNFDNTFDNTLLKNDLVREELRDNLAREVGPTSRDGYWATPVGVSACAERRS